MYQDEILFSKFDNKMIGIELLDEITEESSKKDQKPSI